MDYLQDVKNINFAETDVQIKAAEMLNEASQITAGLQT